MDNSLDPKNPRRRESPGEADPNLPRALSNLQPVAWGQQGTFVDFAGRSVRRGRWHCDVVEVLREIIPRVILRQGIDIVRDLVKEVEDAFDFLEMVFRDAGDEGILCAGGGDIVVAVLAGDEVAFIRNGGAADECDVAHQSGGG